MKAQIVIQAVGEVAFYYSQSYDTQEAEMGFVGGATVIKTDRHKITVEEIHPNTFPVLLKQ
jgi:hypothetical protein